MNRKILIATVVTAALIAGHAERASADAFVGGLVGGFLGAAIGSNVRVQRRPSGTGVSAAVIQTRREIQTALNHFAWNAGVVDGVLGRQSRNAISQYQMYLGFPATGELTEFETRILLTGYQRAVVGGPHVAQIAASHPNGLRGVLNSVRDEMLGVNPQVQVAAPAAPAAPETPPATVAAPAAPAVPDFFRGPGAATAQVSLASHCNRVALVTSANGGLADITTMTDPVFALNEQFCLARGYAIAEGEALVAQIPGATPQAVAEQCAAMGPLLQSHVAALSVQPRDVVLAGVTQFILTSGMSTNDLAATARICLSSGYQTDDLTVALGSAMVLVALGEVSYGELPAHHLMQGIGAAQRRELAAEWFRASVPMDGAVTTDVAFRPGAEGRSRLIHAAVDAVMDGEMARPLAPLAPAAPAMTTPAPVAPTK
ncbi:MAG: peptidoglycan-binding domain-containing protein [Pararhodobacter sp.]